MPVWTIATHRAKTGWQGLSRSTTQRRAHPHGSLAFEKHWWSGGGRTPKWSKMGKFQPDMLKGIQIYIVYIDKYIYSIHTCIYLMVIWKKHAFWIALYILHLGFKERPIFWADLFRGFGVSYPFRKKIQRRANKPSQGKPPTVHSPHPAPKNPYPSRKKKKTSYTHTPYL